MTAKTLLPGDWRSAHYGGDRRMHLFVYPPFHHTKAPACGVRKGLSSYSRPYEPTADRACYDCLAYGASR